MYCWITLYIEVLADFCVVDEERETSCQKPPYVEYQWFNAILVVLEESNGLCKAYGTWKERARGKATGQSV